MRIEAAEALFRSIDLDSNGSIDCAELRSALRLFPMFKSRLQGLDFSSASGEDKRLDMSQFLEILQLKVDFEPSREWQDVLPYHICPKGLEYKFNMDTGGVIARRLK